MFRTITRFIQGNYIVISYMQGSLEDTKIITINRMPVTIKENLAITLDYLYSFLIDKVQIDAIYINQDDINKRNTQVLRIRDIFSQLLVVIIQLREDKIGSTGLDSQVETLFNKLRLYNIILEAYDRQILEVALGININIQESNYNYNELEGFPFLGDVLYFNNKQQADLDNKDKFRPLYFHDLIIIVLFRLTQNPYQTCL